MERKLELKEYTNEWIERFLKARKEIKNILGAEVIEIHHIGSTSIPNMSAKDIVDILVLVKDIIKIDTFNDDMNLNGYNAKGENGIQARRYFQKLSDDGVKHRIHVHVYQIGNKKAYEELKFRDYLRLNNSAFSRYLNAKKEGIQLCKNSIEEYQKYKAKIIRKLLEEADVYFNDSIKAEVDCSFSKEKTWFRYRAAAIIVDDSKVLLAKNSRDNYYYSVGGAVHSGETSYEAVIREVYEETGVVFDMDRLAVIHENIFWGKDPGFEGKICHEICFYYTMKVQNSLEIAHSSTTSCGYDEWVEWVAIDKLEQVIAYPVFLKDYLKSNQEEVIHIVTNRIE
ncbi:GrpB family protein [Facklamia sp. DSM 111018]|uniref:GrpB family protein n=1 Tax=Facklamia lactis TaxID=2749967 RepID=A0ABS0LQC7_9LACT|nr:GrpB family protein [Facklamia lactis]MBG9986202.1 GrpB family protein [Facklamia lactis]